MSSPLRRFGRFALLVGASLALVFPPGAGAVPAQPAGVDGNDFSWPQCPKGVGNGLGNPLPRGHRHFEIVGLTNGTGLHENPCLASQWRYARRHADFVTGYTVPTYPTRRQRADARVGHFGPCGSLDCELRNSGWAQGEYADASLRRVGGHPPFVWVDVEPRSQQPWSANPARNRIVVQAVVASLRSAGYEVGVYSTHYMWNAIVGYATSLPAWVPAGRAGQGCHQPLSRGPVWLGQYAHYYANGDGYDENRLCGRSPALKRMFQPAHPQVTTSRDRSSGRTFMRYSGGRRQSLRHRLRSAPEVVVAHRPAGDVPVFVGVDLDRQVLVRSLGSGWVRVDGTACPRRTAGLARGSRLWIACRTATGTVQLGVVGMADDGFPLTAGPVTDLGGAVVGTPQLVVVNGVVTVRAEFTDGQVWQRTLDQAWQPAPPGSELTAQPAARL